MDEQELYELEDEANWDYATGEAQPGVVLPGAVVAVRFSDDEFARRAALAARQGRTISTIIREAVREKMARPSAGGPPETPPTSRPAPRGRPSRVGT